MKDLITRTTSGLLFLAIMIGAILYGHITFWAISCIIVAIGTYEFLEMTIPKKHDLQKGMSIFVGVILVTLVACITSLPRIPSIYLVIVAIIAYLFALLIPIIELYQKSEKPFENIAVLILPIFYIAVPFVLMNIIYAENNLNILAFFIFVWTSDVGAYCFGMLLGKHKLFPRISPKKSWEGFLGGIITAIIASILVSNFMFDGKNLKHWIIISIITAVFGTLGDLVESMLKRSVGVKDSGNIMPGHGGMLDRFDAVFLAFPIVFVYIIILL